MDIQQILKYLPQRYPFMLIDKVISINPGQSLEAIKNVSVNEPYFMGHFPEWPVMPGVLILEAMAQASIILANKTFEIEGLPQSMHVFAGIDRARFKAVVQPGDQLCLKVSLQARKRNIWKMHGEAFVDGKLVSSADLMSATMEADRD